MPRPSNRGADSTITVNLNLGFAEPVRSFLTSLVEAAVSALSDKIAAVEKSVDDAIARVQADVSTLQAKIDDLQAKVDEGTATAEDVAALERLQAKADALDPVKDSTLDEVPAGENP